MIMSKIKVMEQEVITGKLLHLLIKCSILWEEVVWRRFMKERLKLNWKNQDSKLKDRFH